MDVTLFTAIETGMPFWAVALIATGITVVAVAAILFVAKRVKGGLSDDWVGLLLVAPLLVGLVTLMGAHITQGITYRGAYYGHATEALIEAADASYGVTLTQDHAATLVESARSTPDEGAVERFESVEVMNPTTDAPTTVQLAWFGDEWVLTDDDGEELPSVGTSWE